MIINDFYYVMLSVHTIQVGISKKIIIGGLKKNGFTVSWKLFKFIIFLKKSQINFRLGFTFDLNRHFFFIVRIYLETSDCTLQGNLPANTNFSNELNEESKRCLLAMNLLTNGVYSTGRIRAVSEQFRSC